ncbi:hypothetical protein DFH66_005418, partial [Clostridium beijerinckii]|nr:hypothetical protein [Clostridium beijerinckii]
MRKDNLLSEETLIKEAGKLIKANKMTQK